MYESKLLEIKPERVQRLLGKNNNKSRANGVHTKSLSLPWLVLATPTAAPPPCVPLGSVAAGADTAVTVEQLGQRTAGAPPGQRMTLRHFLHMQGSSQEMGVRWSHASGTVQ